MSLSQSRNVQRLLLAVASIIFVVFCIELPALIGVLDYRALISHPGRGGGATDVSDPELLLVHPPNSSSSGAARGGDFTWMFKIPQSEMTLFRWDVRYDHNGFRNDSDLTRADIAVIGDSFVEGLTVPASQLMTSVLAGLRGEVVANLGQSGYGPLQELIVLKRYGLPLQPHTVVWMFYEGNDLWDVQHYRSELAARHGPPKSGDPSPLSWSACWYRSFTRNALLRLRRQYKLFLRPAGTTRSGIFQAADGRKITVYFFHTAGPLSESDLSAFDETSSTLATAHQLCATQGARLVFVFVPTAFRVLHTLCHYPAVSECRNWVLNGLPERFRQAVASISPHLGYLDLTPYLTDTARNGVLPHYVDDDHWTPEGHKIAAEAINEYLLSTEAR